MFALLLVRKICFIGVFKVEGGNLKVNCSVICGKDL
jgi:hypothetical protein